MTIFNFVKINFIIISLLFFSSCAQKINNKQQKIISIGSGSQNAMYYPVAKSICKIFNKYNQNKNLLCKAKLSKGAEYNISKVQEGKFDMGISQLNLYHDAYFGKNEFLGKPHKNLRNIANLHKEYLTLIVNKRSAINSFSDLKGRRINIGNVGSGSRILFERMIKKMGWTLNDFAKITEKSGSDISTVLCNGRVDAAVYIVGHPNTSFNTMLEKCYTKLVSLTKEEIDKFIQIEPKYFKEDHIDSETYFSSSDKINTFSSQTILFTSNKLDNKIINNFVEILHQHKNELIKL